MVLMLFKTAKSDLDRIQTCNLLSRNQVHYSVMLRGRCKKILFTSPMERPELHFSNPG